MSVPVVELKTNGHTRIPWAFIVLLGTLLLHAGMTWVQFMEIRQTLDRWAVVPERQRVNEVNIHMVCVATHSPCKEP